MKPSVDLDEFRVLARQTGIPLTEQQIATLHEGYGWLEYMVGDLQRPADPTVEPALLFAPEAGK